MRNRIILVLAVIFAAGIAIGQNVSNYMEQGGERWVIGGSLDVVSGGDLDIESGASLKIAGTAITSTATELNAVDGIATTGIVLGNGETLHTGADAVFDFTRDDAGIVTLTCSDNDATAGCTYDAGGASPIVVGSADVTETTIVTDGGTVPIDGTISTPDDITAASSQTATFGAPNKMLQSTLATGFALHNQFVGIPKLGVTHIAVMTNGTTSTAVANPLLGNCSAVVNGTETDDASFFVTGAASYKYVWPGTVAANDGIDCVIAYPAVNDPIHLGFWFRSDTAITSGDIDINFDDGGVTDGTFSTFATTVVDEWQWVELDITTACSGECASVDGIEFLATAQAAAGSDLDGVSMYIDQLAMWKAADEKAIGDIRVGGLIDFSTGLTTPSTSGEQTQGVEWTTHFITYQAGADAIISITDLSATYGTTLEALN